MKYLILYTAVIVLFIPPLLLGIISWIWTPTKAGFHKGPELLPNGYGKCVDNLMDEIRG